MLDEGLTLSVPSALVERIAQRTAELLRGEEGEQTRYLDFTRALEYLGWGPKGRSKLYTLTSTNAIPHIKDGGKLFFDRAELDSYIDSHRRGRL